MIFAFFARLGVPQRLIGPLLGLVALIVLGVAVTLWFRAHDRAVIDHHETGITKQITEATTAANDAAMKNDAARRANDARADERTKGAIDDAAKRNPEAARAGTGPVSRAATDELRKRSGKAGTASR